MQPQPNPPPAEKFDNISKVKNLTTNLREVLSSLMKTASETIRINNMIDSGSSQKSVESPHTRFDKSFEEFYAFCDQIEYNLKTAIECYQQGLSSQRYLPLVVVPTTTDSGPNTDNTLSYPQYLNTVRSQISYLKEIHDLLLEASQNINPTD